MEREVVVYVDVDGAPHLVGRVWSRVRRGRESATFEYDRSWLQDPARFALEPALKVGPGPFHTESDVSLFGALGDSAPDRWGRTLMRRLERRRAASEGRMPRTLREIDFLLQVDDETRLGALRFADTPGGPFLQPAEPGRVPPLIELPKLLNAATSFNDDRESEEDLRLLLAPGSSLGGARPKASVRDRDGHLTIAKFPRSDDDYPVVVWEAVALELASAAGVSVPDARVEHVGASPVLLVRRFDRRAGTRLPFLSMMSLLGARDNELRSYLDLVEALRLHGAFPKTDAQSLWRRLVFNILVSNTDDHLRNHGCLYVGSHGWRLAPAYDLNPVPVDIKPRVLSTAITDDDATASLDLALEVAPFFELQAGQAEGIIRDVGAAVKQWREVARRYGLSAQEVDRMSSAFEHEELRRATR